MDGLIPYLIEAILITTVWEWIFNIWVIEKRIELMGVLGRRISIDDVLSIQLLRGNNTRKGEKLLQNGSSSDSGGFHGRSGTRKPMAKFQNWIMNRPKRVTTESEILSNNDINELKNSQRLAIARQIMIPVREIQTANYRIKHNKLIPCNETMTRYYNSIIIYIYKILIQIQLPLLVNCKL